MKHGTFNRPELFSVQAKNPRKLSAGLWKNKLKKKENFFKFYNTFIRLHSFFFHLVSSFQQDSCELHIFKRFEK